MNTDKSKTDRLCAIMHSITDLQIQKPNDLDQAISVLTPLTEELRLIIGSEVASVLNQYHEVAIGELGQKRETAKGLNDLLDGLGLRIKCEKTGLGGVLIGVPRGDNKGAGRFELLVNGGKRSSYFPKLPHIDVTLKDMKGRQRSGKAGSLEL